MSVETVVSPVPVSVIVEEAPLGLVAVVEAPQDVITDTAKSSVKINDKVRFIGIPFPKQNC